MTIKDATIFSTGQLSTLYEEGEASTISDWLIEHLTGSRKTDRISQSKKKAKSRTGRIVRLLS